MMQVDSVVYGLLVYYQQVLVEDYKYLGLIELSLSADRDSLRIAKGYGGQQQEVARLTAKVAGDQSSIELRHRQHQIIALLLWTPAVVAL